ncbi:MAG: aldo/keto reductase [Alphaproteobacteria bacterium]|nr:aldo/keto reductase [Alphaproteobacteria bacterium]
MQTTQLGRTGIDVSALCLGTMTWGVQTPQADAHAQIDLALERGLNFMDTAEMYPVNPVRAETVGDTETIIGNWISRSGKRDRWVIATKVSGENKSFVRPGQLVSGKTIRAALDGSLRRLQTDYVDLYQLHWPNRGSFHFRQQWHFDPSRQDPAREYAHMVEASQTLKELVSEGKIRAWGLSNESTWGAMKWLQAAAETGGPRIASIQNEYSLMCRQFDTDLAEMSSNEDVSLLAFSPLACGLLTGKYQAGAVPAGSRMSIGETLGGRTNPRAFETVDVYQKLADAYGLDLAQMSIAWCLTRPFPVMPIFGATTLAQLEHALGADALRLPDELVSKIDDAHRAHPSPF